METLKPFTSEVQAAHLELLANGDKVIESKRNKRMPVIVGFVGLILIGVVIVYYEYRLNCKRL